MLFWEIAFWAGFTLLFYSYLGYGLILYILVLIKRSFRLTRRPPEEASFLPDVTVLVAAYNEADFIEEKILNTLSLDYPRDKLHFLFVTDGSDDGTPEIIKQYPQIRLMHQPERAGKIAAVQRAMPEVHSPITVFTDANTLLNKEAIRAIVRNYIDPRVGAVAGEKRIRELDSDDASGAGEGIYWKYESMLKKWDSELYTVVGAAGELFSIRTDLHEDIPRDTLIEDFYTTLRIAQRGYRVRYEPGAYATEAPSESVHEELKRKIRIAAGGIQAVVRLKGLLNPFRYGLLSFQYLSHRVLRWTLAPLCLPLLLVSNILLALHGSLFFQVLLGLQILFYVFAFIGWIMEKRRLKFKAFFVPYYFYIMNYAMYRGFIRFLKGKQSVLWERAKRAKEDEAISQLAN